LHAAADRQPATHDGAEHISDPHADSSLLLPLLPSVRCSTSRTINDPRRPHTRTPLHCIRANKSHQIRSHHHSSSTELTRSAAMKLVGKSINKDGTGQASSRTALSGQ